MLTTFLMKFPILYVLILVLLFFALLMILTGDWWGVAVLVAALAAIFADRWVATRTPAL